MRMPWKSREVVLRDIVAEIIEQEKRIVVGRVPKAEGATQVHARAFERRLARDQFLDRPDRHESPPEAFIVVPLPPDATDQRIVRSFAVLVLRFRRCLRARRWLETPPQESRRGPHRPYRVRSYRLALDQYSANASSG